MEKFGLSQPVENKDLKTAKEIAMEKAEILLSEEGDVNKEQKIGDDDVRIPEFSGKEESPEAFKERRIKEIAEELEKEQKEYSVDINAFGEDLSGRRAELAFEYSKLKGKTFGVFGSEQVKDVENAHKIAKIENEYRESLKSYRKELFEKNPDDAEDIILKTVAEEANKFYDLKTDFRLRENKDTWTQQFFQMNKKIVEGYTRLPKSYKYAMAGVFGLSSLGIGLGVSAGVIGASAGASALAGIGIAGWGRRLLASAATGIAVETFVKGKQEDKEKKDLTKEFGGFTDKFFANKNVELDKRLFDIEGSKDWKKYGRFALALSAGAVALSGVAGKAFGKVFSFGKEMAEELYNANKEAFSSFGDSAKSFFSFGGNMSAPEGNIGDVASIDTTPEHTEIAVDNDSAPESPDLTVEDSQSSLMDKEGYISEGERDPFIPPKGILTDNTLLKKGDGIESVLRRQLEENPEKFGYEGDAKDSLSLRKWSGVSAHKIAIDPKNGFVDSNTGAETRVYYNEKTPTHYILDEDMTVRSIDAKEYPHEIPLDLKDALKVEVVDNHTTGNGEIEPQKDIKDTFRSAGINREPEEMVDIPGKGGMPQSEITHGIDEGLVRENVDGNVLNKYGIGGKPSEMVNIPSGNLDESRDLRNFISQHSGSNLSMDVMIHNMDMVKELGSVDMQESILRVIQEPENKEVMTAFLKNIDGGRYAELFDGAKATVLDNGGLKISFDHKVFAADVDLFLNENGTIAIDGLDQSDWNLDKPIPLTDKSLKEAFNFIGSGQASADTIINNVEIAGVEDLYDTEYRTKRAMVLIQKMGFKIPYAMKIETIAGVPIEINGQPVPEGLLTETEQKILSEYNQGTISTSQTVPSNVDTSNWEKLNTIEQSNKRGLELATKMGINLKDGIKTKLVGMIPVEINGQSVPEELLTNDERETLNIIKNTELK